MPKRKRPEEDPKEQFKRFIDTAKEHDVDDKKADEAFKRMSPETAKRRPKAKASS